MMPARLTRLQRISCSGCALRQYAWTDPDEIVRYVAAHEDQLSGLSKREALKNVAKGLGS
jgi:hypothetical protein